MMGKLRFQILGIFATLCHLGSLNVVSFSNRYPFNIRCRGSNSRPLKHESSSHYNYSFDATNAECQVQILAVTFTLLLIFILKMANSSHFFCLFSSFQHVTI